MKVIDRDEDPSDDSYDSYFFAYFHNIAAALDQIRDAVKTYKPLLPTTLGVSEVVHDTTYVAAASTERGGSLPTEQSNKSGYGLKLASLGQLGQLGQFLRPFQSDSGASTPMPTQNNVQSKPQKPDSLLQQSGSLIASPSSLSTQSGRSVASEQVTPTASVDFSAPQRSSSGTPPGSGGVRSVDFAHTYPPPPSPPSELVHVSTRDSSSSSNSWGMPTWLRTGSRRVFASPSSFSSSSTIGQKGVSEVLSDVGSSSRLTDRSDFGFSVLETRNAAEPEVVEKFRSTFAFDDKEQLLGCKLFICLHTVISL